MSDDSLIAGDNARTGRALLLVLGMHRSGTSALTGLLARLGVELGETLLRATDDNAAGYFENEYVVAAHQSMLLALGRDWHDPRPLQAGWLGSTEAAQTVERLLDVVEPLFAQGQVVAIKDPRASRVVPLWLDVAARVEARPKALLTLRHPDEVAASLARRDGMSPARAYLLWLSHLLDAERDTRGIPRVFVSYDALLADWRGTIGRIDAALGTRLRAALAGTAEGIDDFLDAGLRHHAPRTGTVDEPFRVLALEAYARALECARDPVACYEQPFDDIARAYAEQGAVYIAAVEDAVAFEVPLEVRAERRKLGLDRSRVDAALQLAALRELWRPALLEPRERACKLYFRAGGADFVEARSISLAATESTDGSIEVTFELPTDEPIDEVRVDPDESPGVFSVLALRVNGEPMPDLSRRLGQVHELMLQAPDAGGSFRFTALGHDPFFMLDVGGLLDGPARRIGLAFRRETVASQLGAQIDEHVAGTRNVYGRLLQAQQAIDSALAAHARSLGGTIEGVQTQALAAMETHALTLLQALDVLRADEATSLQAVQERVLSSMETHVLTLLQALDVLRADEATSLQAVQDRVLSSMETHVLTVVQALEASSGASALAHARTAGTLLAVAARLDAVDARLASLDDAQSRLLHWARRRSISYWWGRLLGRPV